MLTHIYTPFVFLPIYAALEHIPRPLIEASQDLGASPRQTFFRVILPLSLPGLLAGATFALCPFDGDSWLQCSPAALRHHDCQPRAIAFRCCL
jgi:spermidine/putrescine transport system permease protein